MVAVGTVVASAYSGVYPAPAYTGPASHPAFPPAFAAYSAPVTNTAPAAGSPEIAEWTRANRPGDTMALTGHMLSAFTGDAEGRDTGFVVSGGNANAGEALIQRLTGRQAAITLPASLPANDLYLLWPRNGNGYGKPVKINQAEAWWVGMDKVYRGKTFSIYGRNLELGNGPCHLYIEGYGWIASDTANSYKATFTVPGGLANGTYSAYAHNGHGGDYGWSSPLSLTVANDYAWNGHVYDVTSYGANGSDANPDDAGIAAALAAANNDVGSTVYFPAGTYYLANIMECRSDKKVVGAGMGQTIIRPSAGFPASTPLVAGWNNLELGDLTIQSTADLKFEDVASFVGRRDIVLRNLEISAEQDPTPRTVLEISNASNLEISGCRFVLSGDVNMTGTSRTRFINCAFLGIDDCNQMVTLKGSQYIDINNCTAGNFDASDYTSGHGWSKGRWLTGAGPSQDCYFGDNTTTDMLPRYDYSKPRWDDPNGVPYQVDQNSGEQIMFEGLVTRFRGPAAVSGQTLVFSNLKVSNGPRIVAIVDGKGLGQTRRITSLNEATGQVVVDAPWNVVPDATSVFSIGNYLSRVVVYHNYLDGRERGAQEPQMGDQTASAGAQSYGGASDFIVDSNTFHQLRYAMPNYSMGSAESNPSYNTIAPNYFNYFAYNTVDDCYYGSPNTVYCEHGSLPIQGNDVAHVGHVWRGNQLKNINGCAFSLGSTFADPSIQLCVYDANNVDGTPQYVSESRGITSQVWIGNRFNATTSTGYVIADSHVPVLRGNTWNVAAYSGAMPGAVLELPVRVAGVGGTSMTNSVPVYNSGTAPLHWSASSDSAWLRVVQGTGTVADEGSTGALLVAVDSAAAPAEGTEAVVTVTGDSGQTRQLTVVYESAAVADPPPPDGPPIPVLNSIAISGVSIVNEQTTAQYTCTASWSDGTTTTVSPTWSENSSYTTIDSSGLLSAGNVAADQGATITASFGGKTDTHAVTIKYVVPVLTDIVISGPTSLNEETVAQYSCTANYSDGTSVAVSPAWSENSAYTTISSSGLLSAGNVAADQNATITASFGGKTDTHAVTIKYVAPVLTGIAVSGSSSVDEQTAAQYNCTANWSDGTVTTVVPGWSENSAHATISAGGLLSAGDVAEDQSVTVTASFGGKTASKLVAIKYVAPPVVVEGISISGPATMEENASGSYVCTATYSDGSTELVNPTWSVDAAFASINASGTVSTGNIEVDSALVVTASFQGFSDTHAVTVWMVGSKVIYPLTGYDGKLVRAQLWDDKTQELIPLGEMDSPNELVIENINSDQWYWLVVDEYDATSGNWVRDHANWINM